MSEHTIFTVSELIEELKKYPQDAFVTMGICLKKSRVVKHSHCARDLVHEVDFVRDGNGEPIMDQVLLHGEP